MNEDSKGDLKNQSSVKDSGRRRDNADLISSYNFINDHRLDEDKVSKSSFSPVNKDTLIHQYQGFKGLNDQINELKKDYEADKIQVSCDIITKAKGLRFLKKV